MDKNLGIIEAINISIGTKRIFIIKEDLIDEKIDTKATWAYPVPVDVLTVDGTIKNTIIINKAFDNKVEVPSNHSVYTSEELCQQSCTEINKRQSTLYKAEVQKIYDLLERAEKISDFYTEVLTNPKASKTTLIQ